MTAYTPEQKRHFAAALQRELDALYCVQHVNGVYQPSGYYYKRKKLSQPITRATWPPFENFRDYLPGRITLSYEAYYYEHNFDGPGSAIWERRCIRKQIWEQEMHDAFSELYDMIGYAPGNQRYEEARSHFETLANVQK